ncbi:hypothetical protein ACROHD_18555, partial [Nioella aestuarii]
MRVTKTLGQPSVVVTVRGGDELKVAGLKRADATNFASLANAEWQRHFVECPSSDNLGHQSGFCFGGSGSSLIE